MDFTGWVFVALLIAVFQAFAYFMFTRESRMLGRLAVKLSAERTSPASCSLSRESQSPYAARHFVTMLANREQP